VAGKIRNARQVILRGARETDDPDDIASLEACAQSMRRSLASLEASMDLDHIRGLEGDAARVYFGVLDRMVREDRDAFRLNGRNRRPPLDRMNALLSFLYTILLSDCVAAAEGVGLDPQVGFLHALRPGRPALALDLMEELRAVLADRLALTLVNRRQVTQKHFELRPGGAVLLTENGRKEVVVAYQKRKQDEVLHPVLEQKVPLGLVPHVQARLLARHLRGDLEHYLPFLYRWGDCTMDILVAYDVATDTAAGRRRLRQVAQVCKDYGQRVQKSVFECTVSDMQYETLCHRLLKCINKEEDSLRLYRLIGPKERYVEVYGIDRFVDFRGPLVV
jgi:CRISPR-associated endonuclease Cas2